MLGVILAPLCFARLFFSMSEATPGHKSANRLSDGNIVGQLGTQVQSYPALPCKPEQFDSTGPTHMPKEIPFRNRSWRISIQQYCMREQGTMNTILKTSIAFSFKFATPTKRIQPTHGTHPFFFENWPKKFIDTGIGSRKNRLGNWE